MKNVNEIDFWLFSFVLLSDKHSNIRDKIILHQSEYQVFSKYEANIATELHKRAISRKQSNFEQKLSRGSVIPGLGYPGARLSRSSVSRGSVIPRLGYPGAQFPGTRLSRDSITPGLNYPGYPRGRLSRSSAQ